MRFVKKIDQQFRASPFGGVTRCPLHTNLTGGGATLMRLEPGSRVPRHMQAGQAYFYVLDGSVRIGGETLEAGDFCSAGLGESLDAEAITLTMLFIAAERPAELG